MDRQQADLLTRQGITALRQGDAAQARFCFASVASTPPPGEDAPWFLLAQACQALGDIEGQDQALTALLASDPRHLGGLLLMAGCKAAQGDSRAASSFYTTALAVADHAGAAQVPQGLVPLLHQAQHYLQQAQGEYGRFLAERLAAEGIQPGAVSPRVDLALDLLLGRKQLYVQEPTSFYFPGLPQRQFYEGHEFDWAEAFEAAAPDMVAELEDLLGRQPGDFAPYVQTRPDRPAAANPLRDDPSWGAHYLWEQGAIVADHAALAPVTMRALELPPMPVITERSPMALYSLLRPGTHIKPHNGMLNTRLICHLPLITNPDCAIRVGNETRSWQRGKLLIFDDSIEHEAWNRGGDTRIILLFEIWRPEISDDERRALTVVFEAISAYGGLSRDQG
ncbi:aspartyl/asparaginyl beta-hydroxylase domain-containing protein [Blastomonas sp.]|uniref:aspartyl/asparaginyl beta-hydroxylase domain-containing protein n=1 Tax=Blastomonas sp. TaxID=1909299 RepID=UPI00391BD4F9